MLITEENRGYVLPEAEAKKCVSSQKPYLLFESKIT